MPTVTVKMLVLFVAMILAQVLVADNVVFADWVTPMIYVLFIILLPFYTPAWLILLSSFAIGIIIDLFHYSPGINASASVFAGFIRTFYFNFLPPGDEPESAQTPHIYFLGFPRFLLYSSIVLFLHHFFLFSVESFGGLPLTEILYRSVLSGLASLFFILIIDLLVFYKRESNR